MRRAVIVATGAIVGVLGVREAIRRGRPELRTRMASQVEKMMAAMPEAAPPARIQRDLTAIREQTARIVEMLEEVRSSGSDRGSL
jgi:hypothetical protein